MRHKRLRPAWKKSGRFSKHTREPPVTNRASIECGRIKREEEDVGTTMRDTRSGRRASRARRPILGARDAGRPLVTGPLQRRWKTPRRATARIGLRTAEL